MKLTSLIPKFVFVSWVYIIAKHRILKKCGLSEKYLRNTILGYFTLPCSKQFWRWKLHKMFVLESAKALRGGERRGSVTPVYIYTYIYSTCVSHFAWAIILKGHFLIHVSQKNFLVCPSIFIERVMKTKCQIWSLVCPRFGLILVHVGTTPSGLGSGFEVAPFSCLPPVQAEATFANLCLGLVISDHM